MWTIWMSCTSALFAAGATEIAPAHDTEGMPRNSDVRDPDGNWIGLVQG